MKLSLTPFIILLFVYQTYSYSQNNSKFWFGAEVGTNRIEWYEDDKTTISPQIGFVAEYEHIKRLSFLGRLKIYKTGLEFFEEELDTRGSAFYLFGGPSYSPEYSGKYEGIVIALPIDLKYCWMKIYKHEFFVQAGATYISELYYKYQNYSESVNPAKFDHNFLSFNYGFGYSYRMNDSMKLHISFDEFYGGQKGQIDERSISFNNVHYNIGILFRKKTK